jgi:hypothetical protein
MARVSRLIIKKATEAEPPVAAKTSKINGILNPTKILGKVDTSIAKTLGVDWV